MRTSRVPIKEGTTILEALELAYLVEGKSYTPDQIRELNQRADQFRRQGELEEALGCCRDAFELVQDGELWAKYPDKLEGYAEGLVHMHYGTVYLAYGEKKLDAALGYYSASEQAFESLNKHYSQAVALMAQGTVHTLQGDLRESWKHNELSLRVFGPSEPLDDALVRLKLIIKEQSEAAKSRYRPRPTTVGPDGSVTGDSGRHGFPQPTLQTVHRDSLFGVYWSQFVNVADAVVILDQRSKNLLSLLENELLNAIELINRETKAEEWDSFNRALDSFHSHSSSKVNKALMEDLRRLLAVLVNRIAKNLANDRHPASIEHLLDMHIQKLEHP